MLNDDSYYCYCGGIIYNYWNYCPDCGRPTGNHMEWGNEDEYNDEP